MFYRLKEEFKLTSFLPVLLEVKENEIKEAEELRKSLAGKAIKEQNINNFIKDFTTANDEYYTIVIGKFSNQKDAIDFIKNKALRSLIIKKILTNCYALEKV